MVKILFIGLILVLLIPGSTVCTDFEPDPVYEHIQKYGSGIDVVTTKEKNKSKSNQLKPKNFKPRKTYK